MPRGDGTGPQGQGPMTGGGFGYCAGYDTPGYANSTRGVAGRGMARGRGGGIGLGLARRRGRGGLATGGVIDTNIDEKTLLQNRLSALEKTISGLKQQLDELDK